MDSYFRSRYARSGFSRTGSTGDGKIFVLPPMTAIRIRTGEVGNAAR